MLLQSRGSGLGGLGDDGGSSDGGTDWGQTATGVLNSTGFSSILSLFGAKTPSSGNYHSSGSSSSGTSPWVWVAGGGVAILGLGLLLRRR